MEPFGNTPFLTGAWRLDGVATTGLGVGRQFEYSAGMEMTAMTTPLGGRLRWGYQTFTYEGVRRYREVWLRHLRSSAGATETYHEFVYDAAGTNHHTWAAVIDQARVSEKAWRFGYGAGPYLGMASQYEEYEYGATPPDPPSWKMRLHKMYTWTQDGDGNPYVGAVAKTLDPGKSYAATTTSYQTVNGYGNVTSAWTTDYTGAVARTYNYTYLTDAAYVSRYIRNRLVAATLTAGGVTTQLVTNVYDNYGQRVLNGVTYSLAMVDRANLSLYGPSYSTGFVYRGNVSEQNTATSPWRMTQYEVTGVAAATWDGAGRKMATPASAGTGCSLPEVLRPNDNAAMQTTVSYDASFQVTGVTGPDGAGSGVGYDGFGRPATSTGPDGAVTTYTYSYGPAIQTATLGTRWKKTTMDGFGRPVKVETGHGTLTESVLETEYGPCACSPLGKVWRVSLPRAPGAAAVWTTYSYDGCGRLKEATAADGSKTSYEYTGNRTKVTDAAGKWKTFTKDALGNLTQVEEPGGEFTYYTYDGLSQLRTVTMPRGGVTQTRTFVYSGGLLTSATNPENGTVSYGYDADWRMSWRVDAKGQRTEWEYDAYGRLAMVRHYAWSGQQLVEDLAQRVVHHYDWSGTIPGWSENTWGRRSASVWGENGGWRYTYKYNEAGRVTGKRLKTAGVMTPVEALYQYDNEGRRTRMTHPDLTVYDHGFDAMGRTDAMRVGGLTVAGAYYGEAGRLENLNGVGYTYNVLGQMTQETAVGQMDLEYRYKAGENNGRIESWKDRISGEEVTYSYDGLNRLASAGTTPGTPVGMQWSRSYVYDGFGNLGATTPLPLNRPVAGYDANGAYIGGYAGGWTPPRYEYDYDVENRLVKDWNYGVSYGYDPTGKRVSVTGPAVPYGEPRVIFYGLEGKRLATYRVKTVPAEQCVNGECQYLELMTSDLWFGGKAVKLQGQGVTTDRLGSVRWRQGGERFRYLPYGEEAVATAGDRDKFGTYFRDWNTGWDYADQRYYGPGSGRFMTPDPYRAKRSSVNNPAVPQSWNRYLYVLGDPVNRRDPRGLCDDCDEPDPDDPDPEPGPEDPWPEDPEPDRRGRPGDGGGTEPDCPTVPTAPARADLNANIAGAEALRADMAKLKDGGHTTFEAAAWLYFQVRNRSEMDYKYDSPQRPSPYEAFGNFNYGAVGAAVGVPQGTLLAAAGFANQMADKPVGLSWLGNLVYTARALAAAATRPDHGDDPSDQLVIREGIEYYNNDCHRR